MIPIKKNIRVVDEFGKEYEETYFKRAKGLIKKGRAHFIDSHTIALVCPPKKLEDKKVENKKKIVDQEYIISKIDQIMNEKEYLVKAINEIVALPKPKKRGDATMYAKTDAITKIVESRETTNKQMIHLLNELSASLKSKE